MTLKKIAVLGPESSGKTTLCEKLSAHFNTSFVPEYARDYLMATGGRYEEKDLLAIALKQREREETLAAQIAENGRQKLFFADTDLRVLQVWSEWQYGRCQNKILHMIAESHYDLLLLCQPDLPWQQDPLRQHPDEADRRRIFLHYLEMVSSQHIPFYVIGGMGEQRALFAVHAVESILQ